MPNLFRIKCGKQCEEAKRNLEFVIEWMGRSVFVAAGIIMSKFVAVVVAAGLSEQSVIGKWIILITSRTMARIKSTDALQPGDIWRDITFPFYFEIGRNNIQNV